MRLIDADELMEHVYRDKLDSRKLIANMVKNAPTIEERKKGEWVTKWHRTFKCHLPMCNCCNRYEPFKTDFCPNCGADMRGGKNNVWNLSI